MLVNKSMLAIALILVTGLSGSDLLSREKAGNQHLAQAWGVQCQTTLGICPVPPQPLNSPCWCGQTAGYVIP